MSDVGDTVGRRGPRPAARVVLVCVLVCACVLAACDGGDGASDATASSSTTAPRREATTGGDAVPAPDGARLTAALERAQGYTWRIVYRVDGVRDVESLTQTWVPPVMTSETTGAAASGADEAARIVFDERTRSLKTCGVGAAAEECEEEAGDSVRPRLRAFSNLAPGALRRTIGAAAARGDARFATRTVAGRSADCVTAPSADGTGITEACVDDESGAVLLLKGLVDNIVFDLLAVEADVAAKAPAAP